jgi:hypothetical protein
VGLGVECYTSVWHDLKRLTDVFPEIAGEWWFSVRRYGILEAIQVENIGQEMLGKSFGVNGS